MPSAKPFPALPADGAPRAAAAGPTAFLATGPANGRRRPAPRGVIGNLLHRLRMNLTLRKYTPETIAPYFRQLGAQVGEGCYIVPTDLGTEPYLIKIGNHVAVAAGVTFVTHDGAAWIFRQEVPDVQVFGPIVIEDNCFIGYGAILCPNIRIGANSIVGAGSVVIADVPPGSLVMGVPARPWGSVARYREKCLALWEAQRPPGVRFDPGETWWNSRHLAYNRARLREHLLRVFAAQLRTDTPPPREEPCASP